MLTVFKNIYRDLVEWTYSTYQNESIAEQHRKKRIKEYELAELSYKSIRYWVLGKSKQ